MSAVAIAAANLRRTLRNRTIMIQSTLMPLMLIFILGAAFGGSGTPQVGVAQVGTGRLADALLHELRAADGIQVVAVGGEADLVRAVEHGELTAGLVIPAGYDAAAAGTGTVELRYLARSDASGQRVGAIVAAAVQRESARLRAARFAAAATGAPFQDSLRAAEAAGAAAPRATVELHTVGTASAGAAEGRFDASAYTQLLLFLFVTALTGAAALIETRQLGLTRRMLTTPTTAWSVIGGEVLGRFATAVAQGLFVMLTSALLFDVHWGDPVAAGALMVAFGLVAAGAAMLLGVVVRNQGVAMGLGPLIGLGMAALGGTMMPLEFFSPTMRTVAHLVTPHAWAVDGFVTLVRHGGDITDIGRQLGVLVAAAAATLTAAAALMRRAVTR